MKKNVEHDALYSTVAFSLAYWAYQENNRVKASKLIRLAHKMETLYRKAHWWEIRRDMVGPIKLVWAEKPPTFPMPPKPVSKIPPPPEPPPPRIFRQGPFGGETQIK